MYIKYAYNKNIRIIIFIFVRMQTSLFSNIQIFINIVTFSLSHLFSFSCFYLALS